MEEMLKPDSYGLYCKIEVVENEFPSNLSGESVPHESKLVKRELDSDVPIPSLNQTSSSVLENNLFELLLLPEVELETLDVTGDTTKSSFNKDPFSNIPSVLTNIKNEVDSQNVESSVRYSSVIDNVSRIIESVSRVPSNESLGSVPNSIGSFPQTSKAKTSKTGLKRVKRLRRKKIIPIKSVLPKKKKKVPQYECEECQRSFASKLGLNRHVLVHVPQVQSYSCSTCSQTFPSSVKLKAHVRTHYACKLCKMSFTGSKCLDKHVLRYHGKSINEPEVESFECDSCNLVFVSKSTLIRHIALHWPTVRGKPEDCKQDEPKQTLVSRERFCCNICKPIKKFRSSFTYYTHLRSHNKCIHCDRSYLDLKLLDKHSFAIHNDGNGFTCERCEKNFIDRRKLTCHVKFAHWELPFQCEKCERSFSRPKTLDRHRKRHCDGTDCSCPVCGKRFVSSGLLEAHMPIHDHELRTVKGQTARIGGVEFTCKLCDKHFTSSRNYSIHVSSKHIGHRAFQCTDCPKTFKWMSTLRAHATIHSATSNDYRHLCSFCGAFFKRRFSLDVHVRAHHVTKENEGRASFKCKLCSKSYLLVSSLKRHVKMTHNPNVGVPKRFSCQNCDKSFQLRSRLEEHSKKHQTNPEYRFKCQLCEKGYSRRDKLVAHLRWHTGEKPFECEYCENGYKSIASLKNHKASRHKEYTSNSIPSCPVCNETFQDLFALKHHRQTQGHNLATTGAPHKCRDCNKSYHSEKILARHVKHVHTKIQTANSYVCEICALVLPKSNLLHYHKRTKHGERNFRCTECDKAFFSCYHLTEHMKRHGEPGFKCNKCGLTYFTSRHLRQHKIRLHSKIKELFICNECHRSISSKASLVIHLRRHSGIRPFHCRVCYKTFTSNGALKFHMGTHS